jgi:hypothetical protein
VARLWLIVSMCCVPGSYFFVQLPSLGPVPFSWPAPPHDTALMSSSEEAFPALPGLGASHPRACALCVTAMILSTLV